MLRRVRRLARHRGAWVAAALAVGMTSVPTAASAAAAPAPSVTWSVTPADANGPDGRRSVDLEVDPGTTTTEHLAVRNLSDVDTTFALTAADGYFTDTGRFNMLEANEASKDAGTWIEVQPTVEVAAGQTAVVPYAVTVPSNATPGDHAAGVAASVRSTATDADGTQIGVDSRVGFRITTRVSGDLAPALSVEGARADYTPSWSLFSPGRVTVSYEATNTGNTTLALGDTVSGVTTEQGSLLPGESREVTGVRTEAWPLGLLFVDVTVDGSAGSGLEATPYTERLVVWAIPWLHLLAALGLALILLAILTGRRRNKTRLETLLREAREEGRRDATEAVPTP